MGKYIDVKDIPYFETTGKNGIKDYYTYKSVIENLPSVDIIRCKDCKYYTEYFPVLRKSKKKVFYCCGGFVDSQMALNPDDYCSYGERRGIE